MRKHCAFKKPIGEIRRLMLFACENGVYLYLFDSFEDVESCEDIWFDTLYDAQDYCDKNYGVSESDWEEIEESVGFCFNDEEPTIKKTSRH